MARYRTKAEKNFEAEMTHAMAARDFAWVESLLLKFGYYIELAEGDQQMNPGGSSSIIEFEPINYTPGERLPEWEMPSFYRESQISSWRKELIQNFDTQAQQDWSK